MTRLFGLGPRAFVFAISLCGGAVVAADTRPIPVQVSPTLTPPDGIGAAEVLIDAADEITPLQRAVIQQRIDTNVRALRARRALEPPSGGGGHAMFAWPLQLASGFSELGFHGISNFVDQDPTYPNHLLDWNCGARTYDLASGYN